MKYFQVASFLTKFYLTFFVGLSLIPLTASAQLPVCDKQSVYVIAGPNIPQLYKFNPTQPYVINVNPVLVNIPEMPIYSLGLAIGKNLYSNNPLVTYYTTAPVNGKLYYHYYDGTSWINTNHLSGDGGGTGYANFGMGRKYIFNYGVATHYISRYDGTSDAIPILNIGLNVGAADIAVDCNDNFYIKNWTYSIDKYDSSGNFLQSYNLINPPVTNSPGALAVIGNNVYYGGSGFFVHGIINNNSVIFPQGSTNFIASVGDFASCAGGIYNSPPLYDTVCSNQLPYSWNGQSYINSGLYNTTVSAMEGCDSILTLDLTVKPSPYVNLGADTSLCSDKSIILNAATQGANYLWQDGSSNPTFKVATTGNYWVNLYIGGCNTSDTIKVEMLDCNCSFIIPNAITPNGDGINDSWIISRQGNCKTINVFVYNRYGSQVYQKNDYQNDWKGTYKGQSLPDATYYYIVTTLTSNNNIRTFKGNITILR